MLTNINRIIELEQEAQNLGKTTRQRLREILYEIELEGGYLARGFHCLKDYYESVFSNYTVNHINSENAMKDYELLLGIPIGTYRAEDFIGLRFKEFLEPNTDWFCVNPKRYKRMSHSLVIATQIRKEWVNIKDKYGDFPTASQIQEYFKATEKIKEKKPNSSKKLNDRVKELIAENQLLLLEINKLKTLKTTTQEHQVHPTTQHHISWLNEENQKLRDKIAKLENLLRQTQKVS